MNLKPAAFFLPFILFFSFCPNGFSQYADLVGKGIKINGPENRSIIGVALNKKTCDELIGALHREDTEHFDKVLESFKVVRIKNHTNAVVLDTKIFENKAKVTILSGMYKSVSGWIPIEWLDGNEKRQPLTRRSRILW